MNILGNKPGFVRTALCAGATLLALPYGQLAAQTSSALTELEEIIVTAQRREERLQDVPIAITVATAEQLQRDQVYSLTDLQRVTPGLEVTQSFGGEATGGGRIRGLGTNVQNNMVTGSVAIVVDQVPQGNTSFPQLFDLAQVEVLRGPQGTLFGQTASAGVINIRTAAPDLTKYQASFGFDLSGKGSLGSTYSTRNVRSVVNLPLTDISALRLAMFYKNEVGVQRNVYLGRNNDTKDFSFRSRYLLQPSDALSFNLTAEYGSQDRDGANFFAIGKAPTGTPLSAASLANQVNCGLTIKESVQQYCSERHPNERVRNLGLSSVIDWAGDSLSFTSVTGFRWKNRGIVDLNYSRQVGVPEASDQRIDNLATQLSQELRIASAGENKLDYTAGLYYSRSKFWTRPIGSLPFGLGSAPVGFSVCAFATPYFCAVPPEFRRSDVLVTSKSAFADLTYDFTDTVTTFAGLRYTQQTASFTYSLFTAANPNGLRLNPARPVEDSNVSGRVGMRVRLSDRTMVYGSAAKGFKGSLLDVTSPAQGVIILDPEITTAYELGTKLSLLDRRLDVDANIFYSSVKDFQTQSAVFVGTALISIPNSVDVKSKGFEVDVIGNLSDQFSMNAGYMYNEAKFPNGYKPDDFAATGRDLSGRQFTYAPKHKLSLSGEASQARSGKVEGFINMNAVYKSEVLLAARTAPGFIYPSHVTVGASIGLRSTDDHWTLSLFGRNLTNENEPIAYLASTWQGQLDGGVRAWPEGNVTLRQVGISFDARF